MRLPRPRLVSPLDGLILVCIAVFAVGLAVVTDRDHQTIMNGQDALVMTVSRLPDWLPRWRPNVIRLYEDVAAILCISGTGLAMTTFRPRQGMLNRGRFGPGHLASALTAIGFIAAIGDLVFLNLRVIVPASTPYQIVRSIAGFSVNLGALWKWLAPQITASIVGAWVVLVLSSSWRRPIDFFDRMGCWTGYLWISLLFCRGFVYLLAWY